MDFLLDWCIQTDADPQDHSRSHCFSHLFESSHFDISADRHRLECINEERKAMKRKNHLEGISAFILMFLLPLLAFIYVLFNGYPF